MASWSATCCCGLSMDVMGESQPMVGGRLHMSACNVDGRSNGGTAPSVGGWVSCEAALLAISVLSGAESTGAMGGFGGGVVGRGGGDEARCCAACCACACCICAAACICCICCACCDSCTAADMRAISATRAISAILAISPTFWSSSWRSCSCFASVCSINCRNARCWCCTSCASRSTRCLCAISSACLCCMWFRSTHVSWIFFCRNCSTTSNAYCLCRSFSSCSFFFRASSCCRLAASSSSCFLRNSSCCCMIVCWSCCCSSCCCWCCCCSCWR
mmetsp:Transcript_40744/g.95190  ORF Transcript_40744/g.95190 Transcript_40744/m.95190 type:complete len:275 (-) Transcript_40744:157-981(-)